MASKFAICVPDYENMVIWCQHHSGKWAPPFPMRNTDKQKTPPEVLIQSEVSDEEKV